MSIQTTIVNAYDSVMDYVMADRRINGFEKAWVEGYAKGWAEGYEEGLAEGIKILILDNLEEGKTEDQIVNKLIKRFNLSEKLAREYYNKFSKVDG